MNVITEMEQRKATLRAEMKLEEERHTKAMRGFKEEFRLAEERIQFVSGDLDEAKVLLGEHVLAVSGSYADAGEGRGAAMSNAKAAILQGGGALKTEYQGTKSYDRWHGQWISCSYNMGPRHGGVIFRIGLTNEARQRDLTEEEIEAALYYLNNLERIQSAKAKAKQAA